jgi:hypothetical protein
MIVGIGRMISYQRVVVVFDDIVVMMTMSPVLMMLSRIVINVGTMIHPSGVDDMVVHDHPHDPRPPPPHYHYHFDHY